MESSNSKPHVVLVASPGVGHLVRVLELSNRLAANQNLHVTTFVVVESHSTATAGTTGESQLVQSAKARRLKNQDIIELPPVTHDTNAPIFTRLSALMHEILPTVRSSISALKHNPTALVVDIFGTPLLEVADQFHMLKYVFVSSAWSNALLLYFPVLDKEAQGVELGELKEPIKMPGCKPVRPADLLDSMMDRTKSDYKMLLQIGLTMRNSDGILVNSWEELDATTLKALREEDGYGKVPVYTVGPVTRPFDNDHGHGHDHPLLHWLDEQPAESVLYISFGSLGVLSPQQITELAFGLEQSQQRFIWVLRTPRNCTSTMEGLDYLPDGFLERTQKVGQVFIKWAPQSDILAHGSIGGFLTHCGWNSSLESILNGVPMIAWPLFAEQKMNATQLAEDYGVAVRPKVAPSKEIVGKEEIEMMARNVMEGNGKAMRARVKELKKSGEKALAEGGSTFNTLSQLANQFQLNCQRQKS
ncbi:hypothetical protein ACB092_11G258400 [Castanea dentata]